MATRSKVLKVVVALAVISGAGLAFLTLTFIQSISSGNWSGWHALVHVATLFTSFGALVGSIAAFDSRSPYSVSERPFLRIELSALFAVGCGFIVWSWHPQNFHPIWLLAVALIGAVLGRFGWSWARYVEYL